MEDSDDELPTLSADTFAALQQFYKEEVSFDMNLLKEKTTFSIFSCRFLNPIKFFKGVFSKPSGNCIVSPNLCFLS